MGHPRRSTSGRAGAAVLIGILALCLSQLAGMGASPARAGAAAPVASTVRIASFNTAAMSTTREAMDDIRALLAEQPDIIALQEMSSWERRERVMKRILNCATCAYDGYVPIPAVQGGTPVLWRSDKFEYLEATWIEVAPETYVGDKGAGPRTMHAKYVIRVKLRDLTTGRKVWILNNHFVPTVQSSKGGRNDNRRRIALYAKHMAGLQAVITDIRKNRGGGLVFVTGDFNVNYRTDKVVQDPIFPYAALGASGLRASYYALGEPKTGTHVLSNGYDKRLIDYVHYPVTRRLVPMAQRIVKGMNSDHRPLLVDVKIMGKGCFQAGKTLC